MRGLGWFSGFLVLGSVLFLVACGGGAMASPPPTQASKASGSATLQTTINHIIFMAQENRSFDHYFGQLDQYRAARGLPQDVDGLPANVSNISWTSYSTPGSTPVMVTPVHMISMCSEDMTPTWLESHYDYNLYNPTSDVFMGDGFAAMAGGYSAHTGGNDVLGQRAMAYYDDQDLPWYSFMASAFAISDRWFSPVPSRTPANRAYMLAATSQGYTYPTTTPLTAETIFELLEKNGLSWKVYVTNKPDPTQAGSTYMSMFPAFTHAHLQTFVPVSQYVTDAQNGTVPAVAMIESGYQSGQDEHPLNDVQTGAAYVAQIVDALLNSPSWKDSVFILTYDEAGGFYDHVKPMTTVNPDGIQPLDIPPGAPTGDFTRTGFRIPLIVISPYTRKAFVSHTPADATAILRFIETRFGLPPLTKRDAMQFDMTEFFDFQNPPWMAPPSQVPTQPTSGPCYFDHLP